MSQEVLEGNSDGFTGLPPDKVWLEEVIITTVKRRGKGNVPHDPIRIITQIFLKDGRLIAEYDPAQPPK